MVTHDRRGRSRSDPDSIGFAGYAYGSQGIVKLVYSRDAELCYVLFDGAIDPKATFICRLTVIGGTGLTVATCRGAREL
jgi:hypothetical protein